MIQYNTDLLDRLIAPGISSFTQADIPDLRPDFEQSTWWYTNHFLNSVLRTPIAAPTQQYIVNLIFRTQAAFRFYHHAREETLHYLDGNQPDNPRVRQYVEAVILWESVFANLAICMDVARKFGKEDVFKKGDGSVGQRVFDIFNDIKHYGDKLSRSRNTTSLPIAPLWLTNKGFSSVGFCVSFLEVAEILREAGTTANELQNPWKI